MLSPKMHTPAIARAAIAALSATGVTAIPCAVACAGSDSDAPLLHEALEDQAPSESGEEYAEREAAA